jgi:uncharacterized protein (TIGR00369 family)
MKRILVENTSSIPGGFRKIELPPAGFVDNNGPLYGKWEGKSVVVGLRIEPRHCNSIGTCHGGMLAFVADMLLAMGSSVQENLGRFLPTISLSCDFMSPAPLGSWIEGRVKVLRTTRTLVFSQGLITTDENVLLRANGTFRLPEANDSRYASTTFLQGD